MKKEQINILIVDDEIVNIWVMKEHLQLANYHVITANSGKDALIEIQDKFPDLVLLDIGMPDIDGFMVLENIKNNTKTKNIPVIMVTAFLETGIYDKSIKMGAFTLITKPINFELLMKEINKVLKSDTSFCNKNTELNEVN